MRTDAAPLSIPHQTPMVIGTGALAVAFTVAARRFGVPSEATS